MEPSHDTTPAGEETAKEITRPAFGAQTLVRGYGKVGLAFVFLVGVCAFTALIWSGMEGGAFVIAAAVIGGYMAINIGANDVANNVGPAVGSKALTLGGALVIAAVFESAGAILAGGDVVATIKKGIIDPGLMPDALTFMNAMMAALLAAALWLNLATFVGAPVSTTHAIVGGVMGAGVAATGLVAVNWPTMGKIAASWVISPVMGGLIAALFLAFIKFFILYKDDKIAAAKRWVPLLVAIMAATFTAYLALKGLKKIWKPEPFVVMAATATALVVAFALVKAWVTKRAVNLENRKRSVYSLFVIPLICSAALLSFAHGANDVANAVGPLAAIVSTAASGGISTKVGIPIWIMVMGALGISVGLVLFGPKLIRTVGGQITKLNPVRAFCVALAAAITVIIASTLGLPVSSTHIAVGGVFGVGFLRELISNWGKTEMVPQPLSAGVTPPEVLRRNPPPGNGWKKSKRKLVRRAHLATIATAWIVTVPAAAAMAAVLFYLLQGLQQV